MAVEQKNFGLFTYVDGDTVSWNKRGEKDTVRNAVDGSSAAGAFQVWNEGKRFRTRKIVYQDPTTFRTKTVIMYTAAAFAAITLKTSTLTFNIEGEVAGVVYTAVAKIPERKPGQRFSNSLVEHA
jgi:hypothetical protein